MISASAMPEDARPRVLFLSPVPYFKGGAERSLMDLVANDRVVPIVVAPAEGPIAEAMRARGIEVHTLDFAGISDIRRPFRVADGVRALGALIEKGRALRDICRDAHIDIVHSNGLKAHMIAVAARWLGGRPAIVHVRDIPYTVLEKLVWRLLRYGADTVIIVSRACWPDARLPRNVVVVHNGVAEAVAAAPTDAADFADGLTLGFIGRIHPAKGLHLLLRWLRAALDAGQDARLVVRGSFAQESPGYEAEIEQLVDELGLRERFRFEGFVSDAAQVYRGLGAVCVPSHVPDPLPRAVMEAMARGLPVLAYPAGGILEMIVDGADGFLVKDAEGFLAAVRALRDPQTRARVCAAAALTVKARFSLPAHHARVSEIYAAALGAAALRPRPADMAAVRT